ncbi:MAG TPA: hypothetical protein VK681_01375, partial [Reyranella sp.]|nr:hypothetical protein [Reyranella sp.]
MDADTDSNVTRPSLSYAAIAEQLLTHRLAQPDLSPGASNEKTALPRAFRRLAEVFALDSAAAAGEPPRAIIAVLAAGLVEATQVGGSRILLKSASGALTPLGNGGASDRSDEVSVEVALTRQDGEIVGALELFDKRSGSFDEGDLVLMARVGSYIAELVVTAGLLPWL